MRLTTTNLVLPLVCLFVLATSCGKKEQQPRLVSLAVAPDTILIPKGNTGDLAVTGTFSDGASREVEVTWASGDAAIATVSSLGRIAAVEVGNTTVTATATADSTISATCTVTVDTPMPTTLIVIPATASVPAGLTEFFSVQADFTDGTQGPTPVTWSSSDTGVATVNTSGLATSNTTGSATITATSTLDPNLTATAALTVTPAIVQSITISPTGATKLVGQTESFAATAHSSDGSSASATVNWSSSDTNVATVDSSGLATAVAGGSATIKAEDQGDPNIYGTATMTVKTLVSISVSPSNASVIVSGTQGFTATATYSDSSTGSEPVTWSSTNTNAASVAGDGTATGVARGSSAITATAVSNTSISGWGTLHVTGLFNRMFVCNEQGGIYTIPNSGGSGTLYLPASSFTGTPWAVRVSQDGQSLYVADSNNNLYSVTISNSQVNMVATGVCCQGLSMDARGNLFGVTNSLNDVRIINTSTWADSQFCTLGVASAMMDTLPSGGDLLVGYWGGVARGSQGGTLTQVYWPSVGLALMSSIDDDHSGKIFVVDAWTAQVEAIQDLNSDGDFLDAGESSIYTTSVPQAIELKVDFKGDMYVASANSPSASQGIWLVKDLNSDGDAQDAGEAVQWSTLSFLAGSGGGDLTFE